MRSITFAGLCLIATAACGGGATGLSTDCSLEDVQSSSKRFATGDEPANAGTSQAVTEGYVQITISDELRALTPPATNSEGGIGGVWFEYQILDATSKSIPLPENPRGPDFPAPATKNVSYRQFDGSQPEPHFFVSTQPELPVSCMITGMVVFEKVCCVSEEGVRFTGELP